MLSDAGDEEGSPWELEEGGCVVNALSEEEVKERKKQNALRWCSFFWSSFIYVPSSESPYHVRRQCLLQLHRVEGRRSAQEAAGSECRRRTSAPC